MNERRGLARAGLAAVATVAVLAAGVALGAVWTTSAAPAPLTPPTVIATFPVESTTFDDLRSVRLAVSHGEAVALTSPGTGLVTRSSCSPGAGIESGTAALYLDDRPIVALATSIPLWRDLTIGTEGNDVRALQEELTRLGRTVPVTGVLRSTTLRAFEDVLDSLGDRASLTGIPRSSVLWIPAPVVSTESCTASTGSQLEAGSEIATVAGGLTSVALRDSLPPDLVPGPRVLNVGGVRAALGEDGVVTDHAALAALGSVPSLRGGGGSEDDAPVGRLSLATALDASVVPPSAIVTATDGATCVFVQADPVPLRVVGSELGRTFVLFDGPPPSSVDIAPTKDASCT